MVIRDDKCYFIEIKKRFSSYYLFKLYSNCSLFVQSRWTMNFVWKYDSLLLHFCIFASCDAVSRVYITISKFLGLSNEKGVFFYIFTSETKNISNKILKEWSVTQVPLKINHWRVHNTHILCLYERFIKK